MARDASRHPNRRRALALMAAPAVPPTLAATPTAEQRALIVCVTRNTAALARLIQAQTGARLQRLEADPPYPSDYPAHVDRVVRENARGDWPAVAAPAVDVAPWDTVFIGFPTWDMALPPPLQRWLREVDLRGKRVLSFNTHAGYGVGSGFDTVARLCAGSTVLPGLSLEGGYEKRGIGLALQGARLQAADRQVHAWLQRVARA